MDRGNFVIRWIETFLLFGGYRGFCHLVYREGFVIWWIEVVVVLMLLLF